MAKRHTLDTSQFQSVVYRLQELVAANSGESTFTEVFKLLVAKITSEDLGTDWKVCCDLNSPSEAAKEIRNLLAKANQRWPQIVGEFPESKLSDAHIPVCTSVLMQVNIRKCGLDILDHTFEFLTSSTSKGALGQYFTPRHVIDACVQFARPDYSDTILDPACGSGGFLFHAWNYIATHSKKKPNSSHFWGLDFDERAVNVARAMMFLSGADDARVMRLNSLLTPSEPQLSGIVQATNEPTIEDLMSVHGVKRGFDLILTNPPFAGEIVEPTMLAAYENSRGTKRVERDTLFVERCVNLLADDGKLIIVLPHNKFGGKSHVELREWLFKNARVYGVIGLDRYAFTPHTHQKTNILLCKRRKSPLKQIPSSEKIFFGVSEKTGRDSSGNDLIKAEWKNREGPTWERVDHDLSELVTAFHEFVDNNKLEW
jgi:type I restriction enzyme M protein